MNQIDLVSVIIPTYGRCSCLIQAIESVLEQDYSSVEIIVVDDNDDIEISNEIKKIVAGFDCVNIKYVGDGCNRGGSGARNYGVKSSNGNYITFLDDDDIYSPSKIKLQMFHLKNEALDVSVCDMYFSKDGKCRDVSNCYSRVGSVNQFLLDGNCYTPMILMKREVFLNIGGFEVTPRYQDHILMLKVFEYGFKVSRLPIKLFTHNYHSGDRVTFSSKSIEGYRLRQKFENKLIHKLTHSELIAYNFNQCIMEMKISRYKKENLACFKSTIKTLSLMRDMSEAYRFVRACIRVLLFPNKLL